MDRIQIAALVLGVGLLMLWWATLPAPQPPTAPPAPERAEPGPPPAQPSMPTPLPLAPGAVPEPIAPQPPTRITQHKTVWLENDAVRLEVSDVGGQLRSAELRAYDDRLGSDAGPVQLVTEPALGTLISAVGEAAPGAERSPMERVMASPHSVTHRVVIDGVEVQRSLTLDNTGYGGRLRIRVSNRSDRSIEPRFSLALYGRERPSDAPDRFQSYQLVTSTGGDLERWLISGIESPGMLDGLFGGGGGVPEPRPYAGVSWTGVESQYFLLAAIPERPEQAGADQRPIGPSTGQVVLGYPPQSVPPGRKVEVGYRLYFGPKIEEAVNAVDPSLDPAVQVGWSWVRPLVAFFADMLVWTHDNVVGNYGVAIILLTIALRLITYPLTQRSMKSMKRLGEIAPEMKQLQEKHKGDRERLSQEMMDLYKRTGINPVSAMGGGCLPMAIQMPFLIALYFALQGSIELRHAPFALWIQDLSAPEALALAGIPIRPLPLLMGGSMLLQQWLSPTTGDPQQRQMMMWMSVIFTFMFYQFPSGLVLYWLVSNLLGIGQQMLVNRRSEALKVKGAA